MAKILKYFEIPIVDSHEWSLRDYIMFIIESAYSSILPFLAGMLVVARHELFWIVMLILPIYFRFKFDNEGKKVRMKKLFFK